MSCEVVQIVRLNIRWSAPLIVFASGRTRVRGVGLASLLAISISRKPWVAKGADADSHAVHSGGRIGGPRRNAPKLESKA